MDEAQPCVRAEGVALTYPGPTAALEDVTFQIDAGQFVSVVGPSGCGKSTLLRLVAGLLNSTRGALCVNGLPPATARRNARMSFVFQDPTLLSWRSVSGNVRLPLELEKRPHPWQPLINAGLEMVGLTEFARRYPSQLSGGMRMRVSLARALVTRPELLLLDEPFAAIDEISRQSLGEELIRLWHSHRWTAMFVTHNIAEAVFLSQRVLVMGPRPGRIVAEVEVPLPYPRQAEMRTQIELAQIVGKVSAELRRACA